VELETNMNNFCMTCGKPLVPGIRFCGQCGAGVAQSTSTSALAPSVAPISGNSSGGAGGNTILATSAAIGSFLWAAVMVLVVLLQLGLAATTKNGEFAALGYWNLVVVALYVVIGIGVLMRKKWAWDWGIGSNTLNLLFGIYQLTQGVLVQVLLLPIELFIMIALYVTKSVVAVVPTQTQRGPGSSVSSAPQHESTQLSPVSSASITAAPPVSTVQGSLEPPKKHRRRVAFALLISGFCVALVAAWWFFFAGGSRKGIWPTTNSQLPSAVVESTPTPTPSAPTQDGATAVLLTYVGREPDSAFFLLPAIRSAFDRLYKENKESTVPYFGGESRIENELGSFAFEKCQLEANTIVVSWIGSISTGIDGNIIAVDVSNGHVVFASQGDQVGITVQGDLEEANQLNTIPKLIRDWIERTKAITSKETGIDPVRIPVKFSKWSL
jgi:hypothetical protein